MASIFRNPSLAWRVLITIIIEVLIFGISLWQTEERLWQCSTICRSLRQEGITRLDRETTEGSICGIALVYLIIYMAPVAEIHINIFWSSYTWVMRCRIITLRCDFLHITLHPGSLINRILASAIYIRIKRDIRKRLGFLSSILCWHIHITGVDILQRRSHGVPLIWLQLFLYPSLVIYQIALVAKLALRFEVNLMAGIAIELLALQITVSTQSLIFIWLIPVSHDVVLDILRSLITLTVSQLGSNLIGFTINDVTEVREWQTIQIADGYLGKLHWHIAVQRWDLLCRSWCTRHIASISQIICILIIIQFCRRWAMPVIIIIPVGIHTAIGSRSPGNELRYYLHLEIRLARAAGSSRRSSSLLVNESENIVISLVESSNCIIWELEVESSLSRFIKSRQLCFLQCCNRLIQLIFP